jgi:DNA-binding response OmpR family regulator
MNGFVLIVDDSLTVRMDLHAAFEDGGFQPIPCATLGQAREALARHAIDVIVLDVQLPDGDGVSFLAELRASDEHRRKAILMLSAEAEVKDRLRGLRTGADEYVGKPYDSGYVVAKSGELLRRHRPPPATTTVLLIDDSLTYRTYLQELLQSHNYAVIAAETGEEGLRLAASRRPEVIMVDGVLPGIDGATVIRRMRLDAALRDVPCMLLTAATEPDTETRILDAGADAFVRKDEPTSVLLAKLAAIVRQASLAQVPGEDTASLYGPKKVLAVDDSDTYLQAVSDALRADSYEVVQARSGEEALELLAAQQVDCILLDLVMPGLGGRETCQRIKSAPAVRDIPLIIVTALDDADTMLNGLGVGADDYIHKTDELDVLKARVRAQIRRKHYQDENRRIREELHRQQMEATEARAARELAETRASLVEELQWRNKELEAFSYSVSHDLRNPLHAIEGFSDNLLDEYGDVLEADGREQLSHINEAAKRMTDLVNALLQLAQANRSGLSTQPTDISAISRDIATELRRSQPGRTLHFSIADDMVADADPHLVRTLLENLLGNASKFTRHADPATIEVGTYTDGDDAVYYVHDNGAGFPADHAAQVFEPFQRLHSQTDFPGTGIGLATVHRIVNRHNGRIWATSDVGHGATFSFTLCRAKPNLDADTNERRRLDPASGASGQSAAGHSIRG